MGLRKGHFRPLRSTFQPASHSDADSTGSTLRVPTAGSVLPPAQNERVFCPPCRRLSVHAVSFRSAPAWPRNEEDFVVRVEALLRYRHTFTALPVLRCIVSTLHWQRPPSCLHHKGKTSIRKMDFEEKFPRNGDRSGGVQASRNRRAERRVESCYNAGNGSLSSTGFPCAARKASDF